MDFDFNLILVPVTLIFFLVWLLDKFVLNNERRKAREMKILSLHGLMISGQSLRLFYAYVHSFMNLLIFLQTRWCRL